MDSQFEFWVGLILGLMMFHVFFGWVYREVFHPCPECVRLRKAKRGTGWHRCQDAPDPAYLFWEIILIYKLCKPLVKILIKFDQWFLHRKTRSKDVVPSAKVVNGR